VNKNYFLFNDGLYKLRQVSILSNPKTRIFYRIQLDVLGTSFDERESQILGNMAIDNACSLNDLMVFEINSMEEASVYIQTLERQHAASLFGIVPLN